MRLKSQIMRIVAPKLEVCGFHSGRKGTESVFITDDRIYAITFDTEKFPPKKLRVIYRVSSSEPMPIFMRLQLSYLRPEFCPSSTLSYETQEELNDYLARVADDTVNIMIPYMHHMKEQWVPTTEEAYQKLSNYPYLRAERFADKYHLTFDPTRENLRELDQILLRMKTNIHYRREEFASNEENIIDLAAYFGQLICIHEEVPNNWRWKMLGHSAYFVVGKASYDCLNRTILAWNCGSEALNYALEQYPL